LKLKRIGYTKSLQQCFNLMLFLHFAKG
jgi:hypothetical protein